MDPVLLDTSPITQEMIERGIKVTAIGFGHKKNDSAINTLTNGVFSPASDDQCLVSHERETKNLGEVEHTTICIPVTGALTTFFGDSGGPVFLDYGSGDHRYRQIGLVQGSSAVNVNALYTIFDNQVRRSGGMTVLEFLQNQGIGRALVSSDYYQIV